MKISDALDQWLDYRAQLCALDRIAPSTLENQRQIARTIAAGIGDITVRTLRKSHADIWIATRLTVCASVTVQGELSQLKQFLNWCVDEGHLAERPRLPTVNVPNMEQELPADSDYVWYLQNLPVRTSEALEFMLLTGLSPHELSRLQPVDYRAEPVSIAIGARDEFRVKQPQRRRVLPLNERAFLIWATHCMGRAGNQPIFPSEASLQKAMRRLFLRSTDAPMRTDGLTPKMMRKWFSSTIAATHSEAVLQRLLGHTPGSRVTRRHYIRTSGEQATQAVNALPVLH